jgi:hypothetical protein
MQCSKEINFYFRRFWLRNNRKTAMQIEVVNSSCIPAIPLQNGLIIREQITVYSFSLKKIISFIPTLSSDRNKYLVSIFVSLYEGGQIIYENTESCIIAPSSWEIISDFFFLLKLPNSCVYFSFLSYHFLDTVPRVWITSLMIIKRPVIEESC